MKKAQKSDWKTEEMLLETEAFLMEIELSESEYELLQNGVIPHEMEDKWFIYFELMITILINQLISCFGNRELMKQYLHKDT